MKKRFIASVIFVGVLLACAIAKSDGDYGYGSFPSYGYVPGAFSQAYGQLRMLEQQHARDINAMKFGQMDEERKRRMAEQENRIRSQQYEVNRLAGYEMAERWEQAERERSAEGRRLRKTGEREAADRGQTFVDREPIVEPEAKRPVIEAGGRFEECVNYFYDGAASDVLKIMNGCNESIHWQNRWAAGDIPSGATASTGETKKEVHANPDFLEIAFCRLDFRAVTAIGGEWTKGRYVCRQR